MKKIIDDTTVSNNLFEAFKKGYKGGKMIAELSRDSEMDELKEFIKSIPFPCSFKVCPWGEYHEGDPNPTCPKEKIDCWKKYIELENKKRTLSVIL